MTFGLACDRDGYDLRIRQCSVCLSRGCADKDRCRPVLKRNDGTIAQVGDVIRFDRGLVYIEPPSHLAVPNRLKGAYINEHGEAV